jgi:hypothetical protein
MSLVVLFLHTASVYEVPHEGGPPSEEKVEEPRQLLNPVYGTDEDVTPTAAPAATRTATATTATTATSSGYETVDAEYSAIGAKRPSEHKFVNPIYGDELTSNIYSQATHNGHSQNEPPQETEPPVSSTYSHVLPPDQGPGDNELDSNEYSHTMHSQNQPPVTSDDPMYSHMVVPGEGPDNDGDNLYSHTNHQPEQPRPKQHQHQTSPGVEYDVLNLPHYDDPNTLQAPAAPEVDIGVRYEVADVGQTATDSTPSAAIYNELEEHMYSTVDK